MHWTQLYGFAQRKVFVLRGQTEPFTADEIYGVPGTQYPDSIAVSPYGICYWANDGTGPRLFNGSTSVSLAPEGTREYFQGEGTALTSALDSNFLFSRLNYQTLYGVYHEGEYYLSDGSTTVVVDLETRVWRTLGVGFGPGVSDQGRLSVMVNPSSVSSKLLFWEEKNQVTDDGTAIPFRLELASETLEDQSEKTKIIQRLYFDINTNTQLLGLALLYAGGGTALALPSFGTSQREMIEIPIVQPGDIIGVRLVGDLIAPVELYGWGADVHLPEPGGSTT